MSILRIWHFHFRWFLYFEHFSHLKCFELRVIVGSDSQYRGIVANSDIPVVAHTNLWFPNAHPNWKFPNAHANLSWKCTPKLGNWKGTPKLKISKCTPRLEIWRNAPILQIWKCMPILEISKCTPKLEIWKCETETKREADEAESSSIINCLESFRKP